MDSIFDIFFDILLFYKYGKNICYVDGLFFHALKLPIVKQKQEKITQNIMLLLEHITAISFSIDTVKTVTK